MKLTEILDGDEIKIHLEAEDKFEAIEELIDLLLSEHELSLRDRDNIIEAVFQRENSVSTGVGGGIAIPHGTIDCIDEIVGAIGISENGIEFDSIDGEPVYIVVLLLVPKAHVRNHIITLAQIARIFNQDKIRNSIRSAGSSKEVLNIIEQSERE